MSRLFLGLAVVMLCVGALGLVLGLASFASPYAGGGGPVLIFGSLGLLGAGIACLFAMAVLDRLDAVASTNRALLATMRGDRD